MVSIDLDQILLILVLKFVHFGIRRRMIRRQLCAFEPGFSPVYKKAGIRKSLMQSSALPVVTYASFSESFTLTLYLSWGLENE